VLTMLDPGMAVEHQQLFSPAVAQRLPGTLRGAAAHGRHSPGAWAGP
jgi:hypothetical protein